MIRRIATAAGLAIAILFAGMTAAQACPDWSRRPPFGDVQINAGQLYNQEYVRNLGAGGGYNLRSCGFSWQGYVAVAPDFDLYYYGGGYALTFEVTSNTDTILLINGPDNVWYFADDTFGINPAITFYNAAPGLYDVWVGTYDPGSNRPATLYIYED